MILKVPKRKCDVGDEYLPESTDRDASFQLQRHETDRVAITHSMNQIHANW